MLPQANLILNCLARHTALADSRRFVVAFSGGMDSTVLLDLTRRALPHLNDASLLAVHVDHGLHPLSSTWSEHCAATAARFGVEFASVRIEVDTTGDTSPEAAARDARYAALSEYIGTGEVLLCAHHQDDQLETVLLQLIRGAGVAGLAGMPELAPFAAGWCLRPLLPTSATQLLDYANRYQLQWLDDPSNRDSRYDRNFLRNEILPGLRARWPGIAATVGRSALHCAAATHLLREIGATDTERVTAQADTIDLPVLLSLSANRQDNTLRTWLKKSCLPTPGTAHLQQLQNLAQGSAVVGCVSWPGCEVRRYRDRLYAMSPLLTNMSGFNGELAVDSSMLLPTSLGQLRCAQTITGGLDPRFCDPSFSVRFRAGGEKIRPRGSAHRRELRTLFQEAGVVPWMRDRIPLLYAGDRLAAVANLWLEHDLSVEQGVRGLALEWDDHPLLY